MVFVKNIFPDNILRESIFSVGFLKELLKRGEELKIVAASSSQFIFLNDWVYVLLEMVMFFLYMFIVQWLLPPAITGILFANKVNFCWSRPEDSSKD